MSLMKEGSRASTERCNSLSSYPDLSDAGTGLAEEQVGAADGGRSLLRVQVTGRNARPARRRAVVEE